MLIVDIEGLLVSQALDTHEQTLATAASAPTHSLKRPGSSGGGAACTTAQTVEPSRADRLVMLLRMLESAAPHGSDIVRAVHFFNTNPDLLWMFARLLRAKGVRSRSTLPSLRELARRVHVLLKEETGDTKWLDAVQQHRLRREAGSGMDVFRRNTLAPSAMVTLHIDCSDRGLHVNNMQIRTSTAQLNFFTWALSHTDTVLPGVCMTVQPPRTPLAAQPCAPTRKRKQPDTASLTRAKQSPTLDKWLSAKRPPPTQTAAPAKQPKPQAPLPLQPVVAPDVPKPTPITTSNSTKPIEYAENLRQHKHTAKKKPAPNKIINVHLQHGLFVFNPMPGL